MAENHVSGMGCKCSAWSENECCCEGVDWRSAREVELEAVVARARQVRKMFDLTLPNELLVAHDLLADALDSLDETTLQDER